MTELIALPRAPGPGRRRADGDDDRRRRRHRPAARARPLPGALRRRLRRVDGDRAAARRVLRRQPLVALDLLRQPAARRRRARRDRRRLPRAPDRGRGTSIDYLGAAVLAGALSSIVLFTSLGGTTYAWGSPEIVVDDRRRRRAARALPVRRGARGGADPAARALPEPHVRASRARSASSSASRSSARSPTCRSTSRS